jgi:hypothetical protein
LKTTRIHTYVVGVYIGVTEQDLSQKTEILVAMTCGFYYYMFFIYVPSCLVTVYYNLKY